MTSRTITLHIPLPSLSGWLRRVLAIGVVIAALLTVVPAWAANGSPTSFAYRGRLVQPDGSYDLQFSLWDAPTAGTRVAGPITFLTVPVASNGYSVVLDFGSTFPGASRFMQVLWRVPGTREFHLVPTRDQLLASPYSLGLHLPLYEPVTADAPGLFVRNSGSGAQSFGLRGDSQTNYGVAGISGSGFAGVYGTSAGSSTNGLYGLVSNTGGSGVFGRNDGSGPGVTGNSNGFGVAGNGFGTSFAGVYGRSVNHNGVFGEVNTADSGVYGHNTGAGYGVTGISKTGTGVYGKTDGTGGVNGVFGLAGTRYGSGVYGQNNGAGFGVAGLSATGIGVQGKSTSGTGGYFGASGSHPAIAIEGGIRVVGSDPFRMPVFEHEVVTAGPSKNTCESGTMAILSNIFLNGHEDAFLFISLPDVTTIYQSVGQIPPDCPMNHWLVAAPPRSVWKNHASFNVLVISRSAG